MAIARCDSVTVSIAADEIGMFKAMFRVKRVVVSASVGRIPLRAGTKETSSKVKASGMSPASIVLPQEGLNQVAVRVCSSAALMLATHLTSFRHYQTAESQCKLSAKSQR